VWGVPSVKYAGSSIRSDSATFSVIIFLYSLTESGSSSSDASEAGGIGGSSSSVVGSFLALLLFKILPASENLILDQNLKE
jgi:hypothetical protein